MVYLRSILFWTYLTVSLPFFWVGGVLVWLLTVPFDPKQRRLTHAYTSFWAAQYLYMMPFLVVRVKGRSHFERRRTYVVVANHVSLGDILVLFCLHRHFKWVSKEAIFNVPFIGWMMRMNKYVALRRGHPNSIARMMHACEDHLRAGSSVMLFPEGTRSRDGRMRRFKHGAFTLAVRNRLPVLPVVVDGTQNALPKHGFLLRETGEMRVHVLPAIEPEALGDDAEDLAHRVRQRMIEELARMRGQSATQVAEAEPLVPQRSAL